jgi:hypothetical protein
MQMQSERVSQDIKSLDYNVVKVMIERTKSDVKVPMKFVDIYIMACRKPLVSNAKYDESNIETRQIVRDNLLRNGHIYVDPKDADSIYITQKAIDEYADY